MLIDLRPRAGAPLAMALLILTPWNAAMAQEPRMSPAQRPDAIRKALEESWPDRPEWLDEYTDILNDTGLGPNDGWHRRALTQTRFDWNSVARQRDADHDGVISRKEFPGSERDFARLDRDRDGTLTKADFNFPANSALTPSPGSLLMYVLDEDGNGKLTPEEVETFFKKSDSGNLGFLSLNDLQVNFTTQTKTSGRPQTGGPSKETLVRALFRQEIGSLQPGPSLNETAPDFSLKTIDGKQEITLSKLVGPKPIVLIFGNFTCGPFRNQAGNIEKLYQLYKDRAEFVMVYVREAHPTDGWRMDSNDVVGITTAQPRTYEERVKMAQTCGKSLGLGFPMLVDGIKDPVGSVYSGMPSRLYLIDQEGKVAFKNGRGPYGFLPAELEHALVLLLQPPVDSSGKAADEQTTKVLTPPSEGPGPIKLLSNREAWERLPKVVEGGLMPLPNWARATAHALPRTTASMLELDRMHRKENPIGPVLRGKMRWVAADTNRCDYSKITAEADLRKAGVSAESIAALRNSDLWPAEERAALSFARQMSLDASRVTDAEVDALRKMYGEHKLVAMVQLLAMSNFQDRLFLGLGIRPEQGGTPAPVAARFDRETKELPTPSRTRASDLERPFVPERVDDPDWMAIGFDVLQKSLESQRANPGRIRVPSSDEVINGFPPDVSKPKSPMRIKWSLVCFGYQPQLAQAWSNCMRSFDADANLDGIFGESLFWVVTRTIHCFY